MPYPVSCDSKIWVWRPIWWRTPRRSGGTATAAKSLPELCKEVETTEQERLFLGEDVKIVRKGMGCSQCNNTGYKGRIAVHEILAIDNTVRRMIVNHNSVEEISAYAREHQHMRTLKESGLILVKEGMTTPEELMKISYE